MPPALAQAAAEELGTTAAVLMDAAMNTTRPVWQDVHVPTGEAAARAASGPPLFRVERYERPH